MKKNNIRRMPYHKTYRREKQLEAEHFEKMMRAGRRKNLAIFLGFMFLIALSITGIFFLTTFIPEAVYSLMGVEL